MTDTGSSEIPLVGNIKFVLYHHMGHGDARDMISGHVATLTFEDESPAHDEDDMVYFAGTVAEVLFDHPFAQGLCFSLFRTDGVAPHSCACSFADGGDPTAGEADGLGPLYARLIRVFDHPGFGTHRYEGTARLKI